MAWEGGEVMDVGINLTGGSHPNQNKWHLLLIWPFEMCEIFIESYGRVLRSFMMLMSASLVGMTYKISLIANFGIWIFPGVVFK